LYELFTGRPAFQAATLRELIQLRTETAPVPPTKHQSDLDPKIERAILHCLERDPARRPKSARELAAALPGGDLLAAAIAMGETPSPAVVAAATRGDEGLSRAAAWSCLAALVLGLSLVTATSPHTRLLPRLALSEPPDAMAGRARELLREHGHASPAVDRAYGYDYDEAEIDRIATTDRSPSRWEALSRPRPPVVTFWYRESLRELSPSGPGFRVSYADPPWVAGMVGLRLDGAGGLLRIDAPPGSSLPLAPPPASDQAPAGSPDPSARTSRLVVGTVRPMLFLAAMFIGAWLARRNLRARRGDTPRAVRLAAAMMAIRIIAWLLGGHLTAGSATLQIMSALAWGLYDFAYAWLFYIAIEPYVRRLWPWLLTSWARLVDGKYADARVGRDLLIGCLAGTGIALLVAAHQAAPVLIGAPPGRPDNVGYVEHQLAALLGPRQQLAEMFGLLRSNIVLLMGFVVILVTARLVLRRPGISLGASFLIFVPLALPKGESLPLNLALAVTSMLVLLWVMMRFGLLAAAVGLVTHTLLESAPLGIGASSWQVAPAALVLAILLGVGMFGFARSLARRGAIGDVLGMD
jgi:serine/threonine-protein kinase